MHSGEEDGREMGKGRRKEVQKEGRKEGKRRGRAVLQIPWRVVIPCALVTVVVLLRVAQFNTMTFRIGQIIAMWLE